VLLLLLTTIIVGSSMHKFIWLLLQVAFLQVLTQELACSPVQPEHNYRKRQRFVVIGPWCTGNVGKRLEKVERSFLDPKEVNRTTWSTIFHTWPLSFEVIAPFSFLT
jgi:hypothetical protein